MFDLRYTNDIVLLVWMGIAFFLSKNVTKKKVTVLCQEEERYSLLFAVVVFFPIFWFVTTIQLRSDMWLYMSSFDAMNMSVNDVFNEWNTINKGPGYYILVAFCKSIGINTFNAFRVVLALLHSIPLLLIYWKYSDDYVYSVFLFIASRSYDGWMMNGMRQFLAATLIFATIPLLLKKRYILVLLVVLLAMTIHQSAIIMIPILVISQLKPWSKMFIFAIIVFAVVLYFYIGHSEWIDEEGLQQTKGSNPLRIIISAAPTVMAFVGRKKLALANNRLINTCVNISMVTVIIYTIATFTSGVLVGRLPGYTTIFNFLLFPYLLNKVFNEAISKNIKIGVSIFYIVYFLIEFYQIYSAYYF